MCSCVVNSYGMRSNAKVKEAPAATQQAKPQSESQMLSMLEALSCALESKAERILDSGDSDSELRSSFLNDVAEAIREQFLP